MLGYCLYMYKARRMCKSVVEENFVTLRYTPNLYVTQEMCKKTVEEEP